MDLFIKLLVMKLEATRAKILVVCCMHIAIANNMSSMGLVTKAINAVKKTNKKGFFTCGNCTKCHAPGRENYPAKDSSCHQQRTRVVMHARRLDTGSRS